LRTGSCGIARLIKRLDVLMRGESSLGQAGNPSESAGGLALSLPVCPRDTIIPVLWQAFRIRTLTFSMDVLLTQENSLAVSPLFALTSLICNIYCGMLVVQ
jgi:hypothetical protein